MGGNVIYTSRGDAPIVISVPHDGTQRIDGAATRQETQRWAAQGGPDPRDEETLSIGHLLRHALRSIGFNANLLWTNVHRSHVDMNRAPDCEPFVDGLGDAYRAYHEHLHAMIARAVQDHGKCLLIDLHGFLRSPGPQSYHIVLGTNEGATCPHGSDRAFAEICRKSYHTVFSPDSTNGVSDRYRGGWIVRSTAQRWEGRCVDAIQVELAASVRLGTTHDRIADTLARATRHAVSRL